MGGKGIGWGSVCWIMAANYEYGDKLLGFAMFCGFSVVNLKSSFFLNETPGLTFRYSTVVSYSRPENSNEVSVPEDEAIMLSRNVSQKNEVIGNCTVKT